MEIGNIPINQTMTQLKAIQIIKVEKNTQISPSHLHLQYGYLLYTFDDNWSCNNSLTAAGLCGL